MRVTKGDLFATLVWAVAVSSIIFQSLYVRPFLSQFDFFLIFLVSVAVGAVLVDVGTVVVSFFGASVLMFLFTYFCLILPALMGVAGLTGQALYSAAVVMIFRNVFPAPFITILIGGFFGSFLGERFRLR